MSDSEHFNACTGYGFDTQTFIVSSYPAGHDLLDFTLTETMPGTDEDILTIPFRRQTETDPDWDIEEGEEKTDKPDSPNSTETDAPPDQADDLSDQAFEKAGLNEFPNPKTGLTPTQEHIMRERYRAKLKEDAAGGWGQVFPDNPMMRMVCGEHPRDIERRMWLNRQDIDTMEIHLSKE